MKTRNMSFKSKLLIIVLMVVVCVGVVYYIEKPVFTINQVNEVFEENPHYRYSYDKFSEDDQEDYRIVYYALLSRLEEAPISVDNEKHMQNILYAVLYDHPELYYVDFSFQYYEDLGSMVLCPKYTYSEEEVTEYNNQLDIIKKALVNQTQNQSDLEKVKTVYDYIIKSVVYKEKDNDQDIISALIDKESVCAGYARSYQYLLDAIGIESCYVTGESIEDPEGHAWLMIKLDNDYYYSDVTWGDNEEGLFAHTCYGYFLMDSNEMLKLYTPETSYEKTQKDQIDYYKTINCYATSYNQSLLSNAVKRGLNNNTRVAEIKCASQSVYNRYKNALNGYLGYTVLSQNNCWSNNSRYLCHDNLWIIELKY